MDRDTNYVAVGAFVLLVIAMAASFVFWYTDQRDKRTYQRYEIYFHGTVSGLTAGSPVRYLGVDVGKVVRIMLEPQQRRRVEVIADIESAAPIDGGTAGFSDACRESPGCCSSIWSRIRRPRPSGPLAQGHRYPVIRSAPSDFDVLLSSLPTSPRTPSSWWTASIRCSATRMCAPFNATLDNARTASERVAGDGARRAGCWSPTCGALRTRWKQRPRICAKSRTTPRRTSKPRWRMCGTSRDISGRVLRINLDRFVAENEPGFSRFTSQSLPEFEQLLRESRDAARDFRDLSRSLKQNPSQLLYESNYHGVEVPQ